MRPRRDAARPQVWALPKGLIDAGEDAPETARARGGRGDGARGRSGRKLGDVRYVYTWEGERVFKIVSFFLLRAVGGPDRRPAAGMEIEVAEARWLPLDDAPRLLSYGGEREMARGGRRARRGFS